MDIISYVRAAAACVPAIGPVVCYYNACELKVEEQAAKNLTNMDFLTRASEVRKNYANFFEKKRLYSICGIVGNVLTLALAVTLVASGILLAGIAIIPCLAMVAVLSGEIPTRAEIAEFRPRTSS